MIKVSMTENDYAVYYFIVNYIKENGYSPSYREIGSGCNIKSTSDIIRVLRKLQGMGKIQIKEGAPRSIKVVGYEFVKIR